MNINETRQPVEFERQRRFKVELPNPEDLYYGLSRSFQPGQTGSVQIVPIGTSHSEDELFAQINVDAMIPNPIFNATFEGYSISVDLRYQNPNYQYWTNEQVAQLQALLVKDYGYDSLERELKERDHSLIIKDNKMDLLYRLNLGFENEKTAWTSQVKEFNKLLTGLNKNHPQHDIIERKLRSILKPLTSSNRPILTDSTIIIKSTDEDLFPLPIEELVDDPEEIRIFKVLTGTWARFVEVAINAMAKVKGIPQSGKLTLLPSYEIPQG